MKKHRSFDGEKDGGEMGRKRMGEGKRMEKKGIAKNVRGSGTENSRE